MLNDVSLMGRLVTDPVVQTVTKDGREIIIARYRLAVGRDYKEGDTRPVDFIPCKAFGADARFAQAYFHKGDTVIVNGRIVSEPYKKTGEEQSYFFTGIQVRKSYLGRRKSDDNSRIRAMTPVQDSGAYIDTDNAENIDAYYSDLPPLPEEDDLDLPQLLGEDGYCFI